MFIMLRVAIVLVVVVATALVSAPQGGVLFSDDFEHGLTGWDVHGVDGVSIQPSGDPGHGQVLVLRPNGDVHALVRGSDQWGDARLEGDAMFPIGGDSYLGFIYNFVRRGDRMDFGDVYVKGNGSYLQVNPHRDYNVGRTLYSEMVVQLTGADAVRPGEWFRFKIEVVGPTCHVYVGDMSAPKLVFSELELDHGALGLQPRSVGDPVWVDNVRVTAIDRFGYDGPPVPPVDYDPSALLTVWEVLGPLERTLDDAARGVGTHPWRPFDTDRRGAVVTGRVVDTHGPRSVAYFRTRIRVDRSQQATLHFSTIDDLAVWVNGRFHWFVGRAPRTWPDFWKQPAHAGQRIPIDLAAGDNVVVIRVRGGDYATGGFFVRLEDATPTSARR
jgi:hypothetical protein